MVVIITAALVASYTIKDFFLLAVALVLTDITKVLHSELIYCLEPQVIAFKPVFCIELG